MSVEEFSNGFDVLVDSYRRFKNFDDKLELDSIEYNEYEKSLYLTKAQEEIIRELYSGSSTYFESTEQNRRELDSLVKLSNPAKITTNTLVDKLIHNTYLLDNDCLYIVYELALFLSNNNCINGSVADVIPVTHDEYLRTIRNPFRGPNNKKVLRLNNGKLQVELVSKYDVLDYLIRYISKPKPIILCDLSPDNIYINGENLPITCLLSDSLHQIILQRAVNLALLSRINNTNNNTSKQNL